LALVVRGARHEAHHHGSQRAPAREGRQLGDAGWQGLFDAAFKHSRNPMVLADERRIQVDVNSAYAQLLSRRPSELVGRPLYEFVRGGPLVTEEEWRERLKQDEFSGDAELRLPSGDTVLVQWAAHPELVTGRRLVLFVGLTTFRAGRHFRRQVEPSDADAVMSDREVEIARLIALGESGPEIAAQLHITHNTVRTHVRNAMNKTSARSRAHLVAKALGAGLVLD
jgi:DNA-binding CsgD family transcriptional regulator